MSSVTDPIFEQRLASLMHGVLNAETGPHPAWADSPAARRLGAGEGTVGRFGRPPLRLLALAAVLAIGGAAAAIGGSMLHVDQVLPIPSNPPTNPPTATPPSTPAPLVGTNGWIAYIPEGGGLAIQKPGGEPVFIQELPGTPSCPKFGPDGLLAVRVVDEPDTNSTSWDIVVIRVVDDGKHYDFVDRLTIQERPANTGSCFEWSPDGTRFAFASLIGADVAFTIADLGGSRVTPFTASRDERPPIPDVLRWSPDGEFIVAAYGARELGVGDAYSEVRILATDGSGGRPLLRSAPNELIDELSWSPDSEHFAYQGHNSSGGSFVRVADTPPDRGPISTSIDDFAGGDLTLSGGPAWSPDGTQLAWVRGGEIIVANTDGSNARGLAPVSSDELGVGWASGQLIWSADGKQLLSEQVSDPAPGPNSSSSVVIYNVDVNGQPPAFLPWTRGNYGRISWQLLPE